MTPAQSVSIVDVRDRRFVAELSTPGCALIMPVEDRGFLMMCGDGTLQLVRLDRNGEESERVRGDVFFSVEEDPVFDKPVRTDAGWKIAEMQLNITRTEGNRWVMQEAERRARAKRSARSE